MAKVTRKKIPRGVELTVDHVFDPLEDMAAEMVASNIDTSQRQSKYGTFRVNFNIPWIDSKYFFDNRKSDTDLGNPFYIPFCLPPLQEFFDGTDPRITDGVPTPVLASIGLSFDQSDEPAAILSQWYGKKALTEVAAGSPTGNQAGYQYKTTGDVYPAGADTPDTFVSNPHLGKKSYSRDDAYAIELSILEKEQTFFGAGGVTNATPSAPGGEVLSLSFPATNYIADAGRFNPITVDGLNRRFNPYKTYIMALKAPKLYDADTLRRAHAALVNVWVTLKFKMELLPRDATTVGAPDNVQNIPEHYGAKGAPTVVVTAPTPVEVAAGELISADGPKGIVSTTGIVAIDDEVKEKFRGGYGEFSMAHQTDTVKDDAAYEVITVPLGQGFPFNRMSVRDDYPFAPYVRGNSYRGREVGSVTGIRQGPYVDRRMIPIVHPMTIHHVVLAMNFTSDRIAKASDITTPHADAGQTEWLNTTEPNGTIRYSVGVGMVSGVRGDNLGYQQVAYEEWVNSNSMSPVAGQIDAIKLGLPACSAPNEYKLMSVPLVLKTGSNGTGYNSDNGKPFFVGDSNTYTHNRTQVGSIVAGGGAGTYAFSGASQGPSNGTEQYLEVRLSVDPTEVADPYTYDVGTNRINWTGVAGMLETDIAIGYGGCWLYIIGKKHLT